jgi:hypothetical protein
MSIGQFGAVSAYLHGGGCAMLCILALFLPNKSNLISNCPTLLSFTNATPILSPWFWIRLPHYHSLARFVSSWTSLVNYSPRLVESTRVHLDSIKGQEAWLPSPKTYKILQPSFTGFLVGTEDHMETRRD